MLRISSTVLREFERCPEKARRRIIRGDHSKKVGDHSIQMAAGVTFDSRVRAALKSDTALIPGLPFDDIIDRQDSWIRDSLRPEAVMYGKWFMKEYKASGAYDDLLVEGVVDADPPEWHDRTIGGVPVTCRPDLLAESNVDARPRILDWKTTGLKSKNGGTIKGGYVSKWVDGENVGGSRTQMKGTGDTPVAHWMTQLGIYCMQHETPHAGVDLLSCKPNRSGLIVAKYRWTFTDEYFDELEARLKRCWLSLQNLDMEQPSEASAARCWAFGRPCEVSEECRYFARWEASR